jgi:hypothetical protein
MKTMFLLFLFLPFSTFAQSITPFDFLESQRKLSERNSISTQNPATKNCVRASDGENSVLSCAIKDEDYNAPIVKVDYPPGQVPALITSALPDKFKEDTKDKKVSCMYRFKLLNDNIAWHIKNGDDYGNTHALDVGVSCSSEDGRSTAFTYSTQLFTKPDFSTWQNNGDGTHSMKTRFNSENIFQLLQDDINQGHVTYWKRGVGFINITDKKQWGLMQSTGQQEWVHDIMNKMQKGEATQYRYQNGSRDQWGAFVVLAIGLQENRKLGEHCTVSVNGDVGARVSTAKDTSTLNLNLQSKFGYSISENSSIYLRAQSETTVRTSSTIVENTLAAGFEKKNSGFVEVGVTQQLGNRKDVYDGKSVITGKNDTLVFLKVGRHF